MKLFQCLPAQITDMDPGAIRCGDHFHPAIRFISPGKRTHIPLFDHDFPVEALAIMFANTIIAGFNASIEEDEIEIEEIDANA